MSGEPVRGESATRTRARDDVGGILILLALALTFRVIIAYLLPGSGFQNDLISFRSWASNLFSEGLNGFYSRPFLHDYTPGYLYVLWLVGGVTKLMGSANPGDLIKIPPILADVALAYLVWTMSRELGAGRWAARLAAILVAINPVTWLDSVVWGQVDSFGVMFLLLGLRELWRDRPERSAFLTVIGAIIKPQLGILVPIVAAVTIRRALWPKDAYGDEEPPERRSTTTAWEWATRGPIRIVTTGLVGLATALLLAVPFGLDPWGLVQQIFKAAGGYPYLSVNAWNPWALLSMDGTGIAANHLWVCDMVVPKEAAAIYDCPQAFMIGAVPAVVVGTLITVVAFLAVSAWVAWRPDRRTMLVGLAVLALAFFVLPTRVHERYLFPLVAIGAILAGVSRRWTVAYIISALATAANMYFVLTTLYPNNPQIRDWLSIGPWLGSAQVIAACAIAQAAVLGFAVTELRASANRRLAEEIERSALDDDDWLDEAGEDETTDAGAPDGEADAPPRPASGAPVPLGSSLATPAAATSGPSSVPATDARRTWPVWSPRPSTGDVGYLGWLRSRLFERPLRPDRTASLEREGGGRLDRLDLWMVVVLAAVLLTGRVWRLGEPYQMHFDEVYHPRTATEFLQFWRYGISHEIYEWTHPHLAKYAMALGIEAFGEDHTEATSDLGVTVRSAAIEPRWDDGRNASRVAGDRLWIATGDEVRAYDLVTRTLIVAVAVPGASAVAVDPISHRILVGTKSGEIRRIGTGALDTARWAGTAPAASALAMVKLDGPITLLQLSSDGGALVAVVGSGPRQQATLIETAGSTVVATVELDTVVAADDAGAGLIALAAGTTVTFLDTTDGSVAATVTADGPIYGMTLVTGVDKDRLFVSYEDEDGPHMALVTAPGVGGTPSLTRTFPLPGDAAGWVGYDVATQMVHVLGTTQDDGSPTVYVLEPHGDPPTIYEDARLPATPSTLLLDDNQRYPSSDRQQLLAFQADGEVATVATGQHAFAWRLPGVLAGVLMAMLLYVLARLLFRRREVAVFLAILVAADGMLFAQSRIGMNDAYVGLGIVAAYTLFAALWRSPGGTRRHWIAFAVGLPAIGVFLGFALASKWVAAYAIGGLGILVLTRSALGRVLLILGMILATTALGYLAISVPAGQDGGNYLFLAIMVGLTLTAVIANVQHPVAWTSEEFWLAVLAPAAGGVALFLAAIGLHLESKHLVLGRISLTPLEASVALMALSGVVYAIFVVAGRVGFGYLAASPPDDDPAALLEPPAKPPEGWLRPGVGYGIPIAYVLICLVAIPLGLYVLSYVPWALDGQWDPLESTCRHASLSIL